MGRHWRQHWTSVRRLAFTEGRIGLKKPRQQSGISSTLVCISSPRWFICSSWRCVDPDDDEEETSGDRSLSIKVRCDASTDFFVESFSFTISYVDPDIAGNRVGEINTQPFSCHWPADDESILLIVTSVVDTTILSITNAAITGLPDPSRKIWERWGCRVEPNGDGGPYICDVTLIFDNNTAAGWIKAAMDLSIPTFFCVVYRGQQANGADGAQRVKRGGCSYLPLDDILLPPTEDMIDDIRDESDDDSDMRRPNPRRFLTTKPGFHNFKWKFQKSIIRQQWYLEVIWNNGLGLFADYEQSIVADENVAWLREHDHIVNPASAGYLANIKHTVRRPAAN